MTDVQQAIRAIRAAYPRAHEIWARTDGDRTVALVRKRGLVITAVHIDLDARAPAATGRR